MLSGIPSDCRDVKKHLSERQIKPLSPKKRGATGERRERGETKRGHTPRKPSLKQAM
jgi:hypothetical protein